MATDHLLNRREFLRTGAASGAALVIGFHLSSTALADQAQDQEKKTPNPFDAWVRITPDNRVTLILAKSEMGQGVYTALPMILAEELCVDWKQVRVEQAPTNPKIYEHGTGGSGSVKGSWLPLRRAGAAAREMLIAAAAQKWEVGSDTCKAEKGSVVHGNPKRYFSYGELIEAASKLPIPNLNTVPLKNHDDFAIVGRDMHRLDNAAKTSGSAGFGIDARVPGMLYAVVARCPVFGGKLASFDATKAKAMPGVRDVISFETSGRGASITGGVAVLADNSWAAIQGRKALEVKWDEGPAANESTGELHKQFLENASKPAKVVRNDGDADSALAAAARKVEAAYELPFAAHVCMEPMNCTVHIRPDGAEAWVNCKVLWTHREISQPGNISRPRPPSPSSGARMARKNRSRQSSAPAQPFLMQRRTSASNTRWRNPACRAPGGAPSNTPAAASSWRASSMNSRLPLARIRLPFG